MPAVGCTFSIGSSLRNFWRGSATWWRRSILRSLGIPTALIYLGFIVDEAISFGAQGQLREPPSGDFSTRPILLPRILWMEICHIRNFAARDCPNPPFAKPILLGPNLTLRKSLMRDFVTQTVSIRILQTLKSVTTSFSRRALKSGCRSFQN